MQKPESIMFGRLFDEAKGFPDFERSGHVRRESQTIDKLRYGILSFRLVLVVFRLIMCSIDGY